MPLRENEPVSVLLSRITADQVAVERREEVGDGETRADVTDVRALRRLDRHSTDVRGKWSTSQRGHAR